ncbi:lysine-specific demethylase 7B-like [Zootermopsis nevadensis]|uniref:lysine-specific demethylase 7B-like n=1 Tax=Zootermopsis nevadensis TaxID=136037 RepID=UPI000B8E9E90|nr:lysine-specific demethylase 7B-like [Zootermopsis nevadensis]
MEAVYCLCGQPYDCNKFMIQCDICKDWFHGSCVGLREYLCNDLDKYHCPRCEPIYGVSLFKLQTNLHRHNYSEPEPENKPVQTGTAVFIKELKSRHFPSADGIVLRLHGHQLTIPYLTQHGFDVPIIIEEKEGLEMLLPPENFTVQDVENYIGPDREVDVIDVTRQTDIRMKLNEFVEYYLSPPEQRSKILNVISLEFSHTGLSQMVDAPYIARKLDWVNFVWPSDLPDDTEFRKPEVQKYCLMGVENSYTDFHVDFGGSSVWYHILRGQKIFYLIRPTQANLSLYQRWMNSSTQSETFFGDQVDMCYKCVMKEGETMLIPTGWIHAVLTPVDSLVFGGNFLHSLNISMQLQIYEIEKKIHTPEKFQFPAFETTNWYAARSIVNDLREMNSMGLKCPLTLLHGVKALIITLKQWNQDKDINKIRREEIPISIQSQKLLKDLSKEVRHAERFLNSLNPPKPERESKRKKKKPINKDFVDFSQAQSMEEPVIIKEPLKLTLKAFSKNTAPIAPHPPLKLTLPKPATYPYSTNAISAKINSSTEVDSAVLSENKLIRRSIDNHVKLKEEEDDIKLSVFGEQTTGFLKSGTVVRFKLGAKDSSRQTSDSVYDFHDESDNDSLIIDELPKKQRHALESFSSLKLPSLYLNGRSEPNSELDVAGEVDVVSDAPKNGIEELLKASGYADRGEHNPRLEDIDSGRASPSTREAIAGVSFHNSFRNRNISNARSIKKIQFSDDYGENIDKVHQDEDYIYPALDGSDDEDLIFKPRGKRKLDEAWNPKARVGPLVPKTDRPTREGTKKQAVEKGLEAAAAKRAGLPSPKRLYNRKKPKLPSEPQASTSPMKKVDVKFRKPKKGMATAKQRLGKILKIHKMKF